MYNLRVVEKQPLEIKKKQNQMVQTVQNASHGVFKIIEKSSQKMRLPKSSTANCFILYFCDDSDELHNTK